MAYHLYIGSKSISSWSLRTWLLFKQFGIPFEETELSLNAPNHLQKTLSKLGPHIHTVPVLTDDEIVIADSMAIAEYLSETFPGLMPEDKIARAQARYICAEMQSSYSNLRGMCPFRCTEKKLSYIHSVALEHELRQLDQHIAYLLTTYGQDNNFLFGDYSVADAYLTAAASCSQVYSIPFSNPVKEYFGRLVAQHAFQEWVAAAQHEHA